MTEQEQLAAIANLDGTQPPESVTPAVDGDDNGVTIPKLDAESLPIDAPSDEDDIEYVMVKTPDPAPPPKNPEAADFSHVDENLKPGKAKDRINQLVFEKKNMERLLANERAAAAAFRDAAQAMKIAMERQSVQTHQTASSAYEIAKQKTQTDLASAKRDLNIAMDAGDTSKVVDAQERIARAVNEQSEVERVSLPEKPVVPPEAEYFDRVQQQVSMHQEVPVNHFRDAWINKHASWYGKQDPIQQEFTGLAQQYSSILIAEGVDPSTQEHWDAIDQRLSSVYNRKYAQNNGQQQQPQQQNTSPVTAAPANQPARPAVAPTVPSTGARVSPAQRTTATKRQVTYTPEDQKASDEFGVPLNWILKAREQRGVPQ